MKSQLSVLCIVALVLCLGGQASGQSRYPRMDRPCFRDMPTPELNECLKTNFQKSLPRFRSGIPGIYVGSIDPLYWPKFAHFFGAGALIQGSLSVKEMNVWGFSNMIIQAVRANVKNPLKMYVEVDWLVPKMDFFGNFRLKAEMGGISFRGAGPFALNMTGVGGTWKVTGKRGKDEPTMKIISFRGAPKIDTFKLWAKGAALNSDQLNDAVIATINRTWRIFHLMANPAVEKEWGNWCKEKLNQVFLNVPYDELFPTQKPTAIAG